MNASSYYFEKVSILWSRRMKLRQRREDLLNRGNRNESRKIKATKIRKAEYQRGENYTQREHRQSAESSLGYSAKYSSALVCEETNNGE